MHASFWRDQTGRTPAQLLEAWPTLTRVARAAISQQVSVTVAVPHRVSETIQHDGVEVRFTPDVRALVRAHAPDILHVHGLAFAGAAPRRVLPANTRVVVQDHGGGLPSRWRRAGLWWSLRDVRGALFTAREQADPYRSVLPRDARVFEVLESSSTFTAGDQDQARAATGLHGNPCVLWVGRLNRNKDPFTALDAIKLAAVELPGLQFWCYYSEADLLPQIRDRVSADPVLRDRVHLMGRVPHVQIQSLARAADFFLSASHSEGSGYAVIEGLACGLTPVLTNIPSFRRITGNGAVGALVPLSDAAAMSRALVRLARQPADERRAAVLAHFREHVSFDAVGRQLRQAYEAVVA